MEKQRKNRIPVPEGKAEPDSEQHANPFYSIVRDSIIGLANAELGADCSTCKNRDTCAILPFVEYCTAHPEDIEPMAETIAKFYSADLTVVITSSVKRTSRDPEELFNKVVQTSLLIGYVAAKGQVIQPITKEASIKAMVGTIASSSSGLGELLQAISDAERQGHGKEETPPDLPF